MTWGLRDYGLEPQVWGGDADCEHEWREPFKRQGMTGGLTEKQVTNSGSYHAPTEQSFCRRCNAWRGSLGLEPTPDLYLTHMVTVFREVRRVLRKDATLWLNMGDSYTSGGRKERDPGQSKLHPAFQGDAFADGLRPDTPEGLKPKDLCMMPARLALALQADGWWLRSEIVWAKPNPMPESITDRPTSSHEKVFLLSKSARYFYDAEAVREKGSPERPWGKLTRQKPEHNSDGRGERFDQYRNDEQSRNLRNVWHIATQPYPEAHFATFPTALVEPCIKAGTSEKGCCPECGAPWVRELNTQRGVSDREARGKGLTSPRNDGNAWNENNGRGFMPTNFETTGWSPSCECHVFPLTPGVILDPFAGSGTTGLVADRLGRDAILIELNPEYAVMAEKRLHADAGMFAEVAT